MTRDNRATWVLPETVNPATHTDWCVPVPDDPQYRAAFLGALAALGSAYNWQDDPDHKARDVAKVWRDIADDLKKCHDDPTPKKVVIDEWEEPLSLHCNIRWHDGVLQVVNGCDCNGDPIWADVCGKDGTDSGNSQPEGTSRPDPGKSKCYSFTLNGNGVWKLPFSVRDGDIVTITNAEGGMWSDDGVEWFCPNGSTNILGVCTGISGTDGGDPASGIDHMRVVYKVGSVYYDGYNTTTTLPDRTGNQDLIFQANDGSLSDNQGSVTLTVCVENGSTAPTAGWCKHFDFTVSDGGFTPLFFSGLNWAAYASGIGWQAGESGTRGIQFDTPMAPPDTIFTRCIIEMDSLPSDDSDPRATVTSEDSLSLVGGPIIDTRIIYDITFSPYTASRMCLIYDPHEGGGPNTTHSIVAVTLYGNGSNPFGSDNC